ncbi:MAG: hypothetical protein H8D34_02180 [Chloroflexi bacterium]|nr:hypothetical protein [Chloroflexota bacterium]
MQKVKPHEFFRLDFDQMVEEGKRQEELLAINMGELALVKKMHGFFSDTVLPLIISDDWVFEAAMRFATEYAIDCIRVLRLTGYEVYQAQQNLMELKTEVQEIINDAKGSGYLVPFTGRKELEKASDFISLLKINRMSRRWKTRVSDLHSRIVDREELHVFTGLRALRDIYESELPRIMYVVKRVIKVVDGIPRKVSDNELQGISEDITWYSRHISSEHPLYPVFGEITSFYKIARNVGNHHQGFKWNPSENSVILKDTNEMIEVNVTEFIQKLRYMIYLCELGFRGILASFCEREQGEISKKLVLEYSKIFPSDWTGGEEGVVEFYS